MIRRRFGISVLAIAFMASFAISLINPATTSAVDAHKFNAAHIIDDYVFYNGNAMSTSEVQAFLNSKVSCDTNGAKSTSYYYNSSSGKVSRSSFKGGKWTTSSRKVYGQRYDTYNKTDIAATPFTCLRDYHQNTPAKNAESGLCGYIPAHSNRSAAQIITDVSTACDVSPKVLIVLLQKEQSLVTDDWPWKDQYRKATGYNCPDSTGCSGYEGYFAQVYYAARQFRRYRADPDNYNYVAGQNNKIYYNPNSSCGYNWVKIQNQATAGLYDYTPYIPNKAALDAGYGTGNSCSAYGNRNFFLYFTDWFGSTYGSGFVSLETPRWMQLTSDTRKVDPITGQEVDDVLPAGKQMYFPDKITIDGIKYLRTQHDSDHNIMKGIPYTSLTEIPIVYEPLDQPRWLETTQPIYKVDPQTNKHAQPVVPAGTQIYFPTKVHVGGITYLRSQHDDDVNLQTGIPYSALRSADISYDKFLEPRWMEANSNTYIQNITDHTQIGAVITKGSQEYFDHKIKINGVTYIYKGIPTAGSYMGVPLNKFEDIHLDFVPLLDPRTMQMRNSAYKYYPVTGKKSELFLAKGRAIAFSQKVTFQGKKYLRTEFDVKNNINRGILLSDLMEEFMPLNQPRYMKPIRENIYKRDATSGVISNTPLQLNTSYYFDTKTHIGGRTFLRMESDTDADNNMVVPAEDLVNASN